MERMLVKRRGRRENCNKTPYGFETMPGPEPYWAKTGQCTPCCIFFLPFGFFVCWAFPFVCSVHFLCFVSCSFFSCFCTLVFLLLFSAVHQPHQYLITLIPFLYWKHHIFSIQASLSSFIFIFFSHIQMKLPRIYQFKVENVTAICHFSLFYLIIQLFGWRELILIRKPDGTHSKVQIYSNWKDLVAWFLSWSTFSLISICRPETFMEVWAKHTKAFSVTLSHERHKYLCCKLAEVSQTLFEERWPALMERPSLPTFAKITKRDKERNQAWSSKTQDKKRKLFTHTEARENSRKAQ